MGMIGPDRERTLFGVYKWCCCLAPKRVNSKRCCHPSLACMRQRCWYCRMTIFPAKSFRRSLEKLKERYLKRIEPKEDDDGELRDTKDEGGDGTEAPVSKFSGKKKGKAKKGESNNALSASSFGLLGEGDDEDNEDSGITKRMLIKKNQDNEVAGFAPNEKQISELLKVGKDKRALKVAKRKLGTHKRAKKREEMAFVLQKMRAAGGGEKKK